MLIIQLHAKFASPGHKKAPAAGAGACLLLWSAGAADAPAYLETFSFRRPLALKPGMAVGCSWLMTLVLGLVKFLVWRSRISKRPKPAMVTFSPLRSTSPMVP